jgi:hypothetical protein
MPLLGRCMGAGILVRNYGAINVAPTRKDKPLLSSKRRPHFQTHKRPWNERKFGHGVPTGRETKNDCAGENQQQIIGLNWTGLELVSHDS